MLRKSIYFGLALGLSLTAFGCSSDPEETPGPDNSDLPCDCGQPKADPEAGAGDGEDAVLAISKLYLGETDRNGNSEGEPWKSFGYNLDNFKSTANSKNVCQPRAGAQKSIHQDGTDGIDNAFGKGILSALSLVIDNPSVEVNDQIDAGSFTVMLKLDKLGTADNYSGINASLYGGGDLGAEPKWDGTDEWPVLAELLEGGDINKPKVKFTDSYVADRTWVGKAKSFDLAVDVQGVSLSLAINNAIITMDLDADNKGAKNGIIAGVLNTDELMESIQSLAPKFGLCGDELEQFQPILDQLAQSSDILSDGSQDPSKVCDGISIGLGFDAKAVQLGEVAEPSEGDDEDDC